MQQTAPIASAPLCTVGSTPVLIDATGPNAPGSRKHGLVCANVGADKPSNSVIKLADVADKKAWHEARKGRVSGSTVATLLGVSPWGDVEALYNQACTLNRWPRDADAPQQEANIYMRLGQEFEERALNAYKQASGLDVHHFNTHLYALPSDPTRFCATPDGLIGKRGVLELKTSFSKQPFPAKVPLYYWTQCMMEMACTHRTWCHLVFWKPTHVTDPKNWRVIHRDALRVFKITYDEFDFENLIWRQASKFMRETSAVSPMSFKKFVEFIKPFQDWQRTVKSSIEVAVKRSCTQVTMPIEVFDAAAMKTKRRGAGPWVVYQDDEQVNAFRSEYLRK